jgi:hypothetical protein
MPHPKALTADEIALMRKLYRNGTGIQEISRRLRRSYVTVQQELVPGVRERIARKKAESAARLRAGDNVVSLQDARRAGPSVPYAVRYEADAASREMDDMPLTAVLFGDPPFSRSALAQKVKSL